MDGENPTTPKIASLKMERKLTDLEVKALALEKEFDKLLKRTAEMEQWTKQYATKVTEEKRLIGLVHAFVRPGDKRATMLMHHLSVFFDEILTRLESRGVRYNSLKFLYRDIEKEEVCVAFETILHEMDFTGNEMKDLKLIIQLFHSRIGMRTGIEGMCELHNPDNDPTVASQEMNVFLQIRDEIDEPLKFLLKKIVTNCYKKREDATPMKCEDATPMKCEDATLMKCEDATPMKCEDATSMKWKDATSMK